MARGGGGAQGGRSGTGKQRRPAGSGSFSSSPLVRVRFVRAAEAAKCKNIMCQNSCGREAIYTGL